MTKDKKLKTLLEAMVAITQVNEGSPVKTYQRMEQLAQEAIQKVKEGSHD